MGTIPSREPPSLAFFLLDYSVERHEGDHMTVTRRKLLRSTALGAAAGTVGPFVICDLHAEDSIKVAGIHDTSGGLDIYGKQMVATLELAVSEINGGGGLLGRKIQLINYDPQSNIQLYTQYATEAATKEKVAVVQGGITSASREAIRPLLKRFNTLYFYNTLYEGGVCDRNIFCTGSTPAQTVEKLVPYVQKKWGKKIYTIAADYNYGQITAKWVKKYAQDNGGSVVQTDFFPLDVTDFGATIKKIQAAKPDLVISVLVGAAHISFYRQWAAAGMNKQIPLGSPTFGNEVVITSPEEHNGFVVAYAYLESIDTPVNKAFVETVHTKYGIPYMTELAAMTYHGVHLWADAVKKAGTIDRMKVIQALEDNASYDGPAGKTTIDPQTHHTILDVYIGEAKDKTIMVLEKFAQQEPADTAAVCDLKKNPNDNKQYVIDVKT
jgi:urea transport system substrate-binding protein